MAVSLRSSFSAVLLVWILLVSPCFSFKHKSFNFSSSEAALSWNTASATWYGSPTGAGPDDNGGGCGYKNVNLPPFSSMTSCGNPALFKSGEGCGSCYKVKCTSHPACSGKPSTLTITDACLGGVCLDKTYHFDMSGTLFGSMAVPGKEDVLRHAGILPVQFARVPCEYPGRNIAFHVEEGSNPNYLAILVEYEDGDGDLQSVDIMESSSSSSSSQSSYSNTWTPMKESWGAIWRLDTSRPLQGPFSIRLKTDTSGRSLVARNVIPANWQPNQVYRSIVNFST